MKGWYKWERDFIIGGTGDDIIKEDNDAFIIFSLEIVSLILNMLPYGDNGDTQVMYIISQFRNSFLVDCIVHHTIEFYDKLGVTTTKGRHISS